jgi:hypothetical protein
METCDRVVILSFRDFRVQPLATTNSGARKFEQSVHIPSLLLEFGEVESNRIKSMVVSLSVVGKLVPQGRGAT